MGLACIHIARALGASSIAGTASTPEGRHLVLKHGADFAIDYRAEDFREQLKVINLGLLSTMFASQMVVTVQHLLLSIALPLHLQVDSKQRIF